MFKPFDRRDNDIGTYFTRALTNDVYEVIGYITEPAAILQNVRTGEQHTVIIGAPIAKEYFRLIPEKPDA